MKKILISAAVMVAAMSACSKNEVLQNESPNNAVAFGLYSSNASRGVITELSTIQAAGFGVFGSFLDNATATTAPNFMYNQHVTYSGTAWSYSPIKYYSNDTSDRYSFYGYAPYVASTATTGVIIVSGSDENPAITYTIDPTDLASTLDFVAGQVVSMEKPAAGTNVTINLKHQLTRIGITAKTDIDDATVDNKTSVIIKSVNFVNGATTQLPVSGVYTFGTATSVADEETHTNDGAWKVTPSTDDFDFSSLFLAAADLNPEIGGYPAKTGIQILDTEEEKSLFLADNFAFLLPPNGQNGLAANSDLKLVIEYDIVTEDDELDAGHTFSSNKATFTLASDGLLKQGRAYNFELTFSLQGVKLAATVANWDTLELDGTTTVEHEASVETII